MSPHVTSEPQNLIATTQIALEFRQATALHGQGSIAQATAIYEHILRKQPDHCDALHHLGVIAYQTGNFHKATELIAKAIKCLPDNATYHSNYGLVLQELGELEAALKSFDRAIALQPAFPSAVINRSNVLQIMGRYGEALEACTLAVALAPQDADTYYNQGAALQAMKRISDAVASYDRAIALSPEYCDAHVNRGNALQDLNRFEEAISAYDSALAINNKMMIAYANRGAAYQKMQCLNEALADFDRALDLDKTAAFVFMGRGVVYKNLGRWAEALADFSQALRLEPNNFEARKNFFWIHLLNFEDAALVERLGQEMAQLTADSDVARLRSTKSAQNFRILHDLEQAAYLMREPPLSGDVADVEAGLRGFTARALQMQAGGKTENAMIVSDDEVEILTRFRKKALRYAPLCPREALNFNNDWVSIENRYLQAKPEIVVIDDFLTPEALAQLHRFCMISTVWRTEYGNAYLGTFPEHGFVSPLHLQIATELRRAFPRIIGDYPLEQLWAFKYTAKTGKGIGIHADFARVNLNFWITPNDANLDPTSGGMKVYDVPAPREWGFYDYNGASEKIEAFLKAHNSDSQTIPYKCNRAVLFNSNLFHKTSDIHFKEGYENRRINVTYLFGVGQKFT